MGSSLVSLGYLAETPPQYLQEVQEVLEGQAGLGVQRVPTEDS